MWMTETVLELRQVELHIEPGSLRKGSNWSRNGGWEGLVGLLSSTEGTYGLERVMPIAPRLHHQAHLSKQDPSGGSFTRGD